jgi:hypothetical protein
MKPKILLRIVAGLLLFHIVGHTIGTTTWRQTNDPAIQEVINQMSGPTFELMGSARTFADLYVGYGITGSFTLALLLAIVWILSRQSAEPKTAVAVLWPVAACLLAYTVIDFMYFFFLPAVICLLSAVLIIASIMQLRKQPVGLAT